VSRQLIAFFILCVTCVLTFVLLSRATLAPQSNGPAVDRLKQLPRYPSGYRDVDPGLTLAAYAVFITGLTVACCVAYIRGEDID
jgi:hypothetical protein